MKFNQQFSSKFRILSKGRVVLAISVIAANILHASPEVNALPTNPSIVSGNININAPSSNTLNINQASNKGIINWGSFNIGSAATVNFKQPNVNSSTLNRVVGGGLSQIAGNLNANGNVILINPNGVVFQNGSRVDVGSITASTMNLKDEDFLNDKLNFTRDGNIGKVINKGTITAKDKGYVALLAPEVQNDGVIKAVKGSVAFASGDAITLDLDGDGLLNVEVEAATIDTLIENKGLVQADGGLVYMSSKAATDAYASTVSNSGKVSASSMEEVGGKIVFLGSDITNEGTLEAKGKTGGGEILVGGDWQGTNSETYHEATTVTTTQTSIIDASATESGDAGKVVLWSDIKDENSITSVKGTINAKGGDVLGDGGKVETSGYKLDVNGINLSASASNGKGGEWLLDPNNITINDTGTTTGGSNSLPTYTSNADDTIIDKDDIVSQLNSGTSVTIQTGSGGSQNGDITLASSIVTGAMANDATLTLKAHRDIIVNTGVSIDATQNSNTNKLNIILNSDSDNSYISSNNSSTAGAIQVNSAAILKSNGGNIILGGGSDIITGYALATGILTNVGIQLDNVTIDSNNGDITIRGMGNHADGESLGVLLGAGTSISSGTGQINITGRSEGFIDSTTGLRNGIRMQGTSADHITISSTSTASNAITLSGQEGYTNTTINASGGTGNDREGLAFIYTDITSIGGVTFAADKQVYNNTTLSTSGTSNSLSITSYESDSFWEAFNWNGTLSGSNFVGSESIAGLTINGFSNLGGLTIGKPTSTSNSSVQLKSDIAINGSVNVFADDLFSTGSITTSNNGNILLKSQGYLVFDPNNNLSTDGGDIILWSNTVNTTTGAENNEVDLRDNNTLSSNGGNIIVAGGLDDGSNGGTANDGIADGYAYRGYNDTIFAADFGGDVILDSSSATNGGDIIIRGSGYGVGVKSDGALKIDSGTGTITIDGKSTQENGVEFNGDAIAITTENTTSDAIKITGTTIGSGKYGVVLGSGGTTSRNTLIQATDSNGGITISGTSADSIGLYGTQRGTLQILSQSGDITLKGQNLDGSTGETNADFRNGDGDNNILFYLGNQKAATTVNGVTSSVTSSSSNIKLQADYLSWNSNEPVINTTGDFTVEPVSNSFSTSQNVKTSWFTFTNIGGLTIGKSTNIQDVTVNESVNAKGDINLFGKDITISENLDTSTQSAGNILLKASDNIRVVASKSITTNGGNITLWSNSDDNGGYIYIQDGVTLDTRTALDRTAGNTNTASGGGDITLGGGAGTTTPTGYALQNTTSTTPAGIMLGTTGAVHDSDIAIYSGGGNISLKGKATNSSNSSEMSGIYAYSGLKLDSGSVGDILFDGSAGNDAITSVKGISLHGLSSDNLYLRSSNGDITLNGLASGHPNAAYGVFLEGHGAGLSENFIEATGTGNVTITGSAEGGQATSRDFHIRALSVLAKSGDITISGTSSDIYKRGRIEWARIGSNNYTETNGDANLVTSSSSNISVSHDFLDFAGTVTVNTSGTFNVASYNDDFLYNASEQTSFSIPSNLVIANSVTGLTIGKSATSSDGTNDLDVTISEAIDISGDINIYGKNININQNIDTSDGSDRDVLLKASGNIITANSKDITTDGGDIIFWSDSDSSTAGYIKIGDQSDLTSNGGDITLSGGSALSTGYANGSTNTYGISIGVDGSNINNINSSGGDILIRGSSLLDNNSATHLYGVNLSTGVNIDSGVGSVSIYGKSTDSYGINLSLGTSTGINIKSAKTTGTAITLDGWSNASYGLVFNFDVNKQILATGGGDISLKGVATTADYGIFIQGIDILASSGDITLDGGTRGITKGGNLASNIGSVAGDSNISSSTSNIDIIGDSLNIASSVSIKSTGELSLLSSGDSFSSSISTSNFDIQNSITGLTIGKTTNTEDITIGSNTTIAGDIDIYGGNITINGNLDTSSVTSGDILLKASGNITQASSKSVSTNGGDVIYWSNSDNGTNSDGAVLLLKDSSIITNGANVWIGGGSGTTTWNELTVGNGYALSRGSAIPDDRYDREDSGTLSAFITAVYLEDTQINTNGGNISIYAKADLSGGYGLTTFAVNDIASGSGKIYIDAIADDNRAGVFGMHGQHIDTETTFSSTNSDVDAISLNFDATSGTQYGSVIAAGKLNILSNTGGINYNTFGNSNSAGVRFGYSTTSDGELNMLSNSGDITFNSGTYGVKIEPGNGNSSINFGRKATSPVTTSSSDITFISDEFTSDGSMTFNTSGTVAIKPTDTNSFTSEFDTSDIIYSSDISGLTIGHSANTGDVKIGSSTLIAGDINIYGGDITINNKLEATNSTITLDGSGNITDGTSGYVVATNLALLDGAVTLNHANNDVDNIAGTTLDSLTFYDTDGLTIGSTIASTTGISSTGNVILSAGADEAAGTSTGGDIILSGTPTISSTSGNVKLYTGSIANSAGLTTFVGSGSGKFRYNSDETNTNYTTALGSTGTYAIYREQPSVSGTISEETITYGDTNPNFTMSGGTGLVNGDSSSGFTIVGSSNSTAGKLEADVYDVSASGLSALGYSVSTVTNGKLTVNKKALTVTGLTAQDKTYDATNSATLSNAGTLSGKVTGDSLSFTTASTFNNANVEATKILNLDYTLAGTDKDNYTLADLTSQTTSAKITAKEVTLSASKTYDGTTDLTSDVTLGGFIGTQTLNYSGATSNDSHVATANKYINVITLTNGSNGGIATNYKLPTLNSSNAAVTINAATLTPTISNTSVTKTYDGITDASSNLTPTYTFSGFVSGDTNASLGYTGASYDNANVTSASKVTLSGLSISSITGSNSSSASDYVLDSNSKEVAATITKVNLTVSANDDAKFVTQNDPTFAASYSGFVNGEDENDLTGTLAITRSNSTTNIAGVYSDVLVASGLSSNNYSFTYEDGDFTIVPSDQLLVKITNVSNDYGVNTNYALSSVEYYNGTNVVTLGAGTGTTTITNNDVNISDGSGGTATFSVGAVNSSISTANKLNAGSYQLGIDGIVTENSGNFSDTVTLVGTHQVNKKSITASASSVSKEYDANTAMNGVNLSLSTLELNDVVTVSGIGAFDSKNVGTGLDYTINNVVLNGTDASNYYLSGGTSFTGSNGVITTKELTIDYTARNKVYDGDTIASVSKTNNIISGDDVVISETANFSDKNVADAKIVSIVTTLSGNDKDNYNLVNSSTTKTADITRLNSVTWIGGTSGNWFDPSNWAGGAVPDLSNVANVVIPSGTVVNFDTSGAVSPADASSAVNIDSLGTLGSLTMADGELNIQNSMTLDTFTQNGGTLTAGSITTNTYNQTAGSSTSDSLTTDTLIQSGGTTITDTLTVNDSFSQSGTTGQITVNNNANITQTNGNMQIGNLDVGGNLTANANNGDIVQVNGTTIDVTGLTTLNSSGDITLDSITNNFTTLALNAVNATIVDGVGGIVLSDVTTSGNLNISSLGGDITQTDSSKINVARTSTFDAGSNDIILDNQDNEFNGNVNLSGNSARIQGKTRPTIGNQNLRNGLIIVDQSASFVKNPEIKAINPKPTNPNKDGVDPLNSNLKTDTTPVSNEVATNNTSTEVSPSNTQSTDDKNLSTQDSNIDQNNNTMSFDGITVGSTQTGVEVKAIIVQGSASSNAPVTMLVSVKAQEGLNFTIPKSIVSQVTKTAQAPAKVIGATLSDGKELPSWISFDMTTSSFTSANVPLNGLPLTVKVITSNGKAIEVVLKNK